MPTFVALGRHGRLPASFLKVCDMETRRAVFFLPPDWIRLQKGFVEKLVQRIVDNIEIDVADIHIRCATAFLGGCTTPRTCTPVQEASCIIAGYFMGI